MQWCSKELAYSESEGGWEEEREKEREVGRERSREVERRKETYKGGIFTLRFKQDDLPLKVSDASMW